MTRIISLLLATAGLVFAHGVSNAQGNDFPMKPIRIVSAFSAGSGPDAMLRLIGERLSATWKQPVVIDNRPGGSGFIAASEVKRAQPDGYVLLHADGLNFTAIPQMYKKIPYDAAKDFSPVVPLHYSNFFIAVSSQSKWSSVGDLLAAARTEPGRVTYGSWQIGSVAHLGSAALDAAAGTRMTHVPFKDNGQLYSAVATGDVDWAFGTAGSAGPLQKAGKLKFLALAGPQSLPTHPNVPVVGKSGGPAGFDVSGWVGLFAPGGTPKGIVDRINADVIKIVEQGDLAAKMSEFGYYPLAIKPEAMAERIHKEVASYANTVKQINLSLD